MITQLLYLTTEFNAANGIKLDVSGWDYATIQAVSPSGTINITATNDGGANSDASTSQNYTGVLATKLVDNSSVSSIAAAGLYRVVISAKYLSIGGASAAATSLLVNLQKVC